MLIVSYDLDTDTTRLCDRDGCENYGNYTAIAMGGAIVEHLCDRHTAQHMRGNAYALCGRDDEPDAREAQMLNELDRWG